jgi:dTDP-4-dehydrorhamnose reductase
VIVVFGGNGQLGCELKRGAAARGIAVHALSRAEADISDSAAVTAALLRRRPDLVVNAAAYTRVDLAETELADARLANEIGPAVLARACAAAGVPLLHVSTDYVFDGTKDGCYLENDPIHPINAYGRSKAAGEEAVRLALKHHVILRTSWLYSEYGENFLKTVLRLAAARDELRIVADQHGSPTSARELAGAIFHLAPLVARDTGLSGTYHCTASGFTTWHGFASRIVAVAAPLIGRHPTVTAIPSADYPTPAGRPANSRLDCSLFARTFQYTARHWSEAVDETIRALVAPPRQAPSQAPSHVA